jgi:basic amino acid/polyamine antiporter, APA family
MSAASEEVQDVTVHEKEPALKRVLGPKLLLPFIVGDFLNRRTNDGDRVNP